MSKIVGQKVKFEINLENSHAPQEIKAVNGANIEIRYDSGKIYDPKTEEICPRCEGGGMYMECYGHNPVEVKCETCDGWGIVEKEILEPHYPEEFKNSLIKDPFKVRDLHDRSLDCAAELFEVEYQGEDRVGFQNKIISAIEYYAAGQIQEPSNHHVDVYYLADAGLDKFVMDHWGIARMQTMNEDDTIRLETDDEFRDRIVRTITCDDKHLKLWKSLEASADAFEKSISDSKSSQKSKIKGISPNEVINLSQGSKNDD